MKCPHCGSDTHIVGIVFSRAGVLWQGELLRLTPKQYQIFRILWEHDFIGHGTVTPRPKDRKSMPLSVAICHIRKELKRLNMPFVIRPVPREGYVLQPKLPTG